DHLSDAPARQAFTRGIWCTDFILEHDGLGSRLAFENQWELPRRWRMTGAFKSKLVGEIEHAIPPPARRSRNGNLTIFVSSDHPVETIAVPTTFEAMQHALAVDGQWAEQYAEHGRIYPPRKIAWAQPSSEARYMTGVLGMMGGLQRVTEILLHPFLQKIFARLGGTSSLHAGEVTPTINRLRKRARGEIVFDLNADDERQALANLIVTAARELKNPMSYIKYTELKERWKTHREAFWATQPLQHEPDPDVDWDEHEMQSLDACLTGLRRDQVMFQGHQWTCQKCHYRNWVDLASLSSEMSCEVCKRPTQAPVDIDWLFRPNGFLIECLRDHSVLSLVWVLSALRSRSRRSLIFVEPMCFGFANDSVSPDAEADLLAIIDGQAMLCEVKASWRILRHTDIRKFVKLATRLRPDTALLAVMENGSGPAAVLSEPRAQLSAEGIEFELLTPDKYWPDDGPYLPS
ncbi:MAG: hypothetical protein HOH46_20560, partial [Rhodospirillaceae bacterium]|nr:hypothetical protein [Rhodospirillaceae bacterium]